MPEQLKFGPIAQALGNLLEETSPALSRAFLGAASSLAAPFTAGMGMRVDRLDDTGRSATLPDWWRNRDETGRPHPAAVAALVELASRSYWARHLDPASATAQMKRLECRWSKPGRGALRADLSRTDEEREEILLQLRAEGQAVATCALQIYDRAGHLVGEAEADWELRSRILLTGAANP
jgi:hypothetical protein